MTSPKSDIVCRGCWALGNNCERCSKCRETEAAYLREQMADACEKAGKFAHWAQTEIRRLEAELTEQKALVASLQGLLEKAMDRIAAQSDLLSKRAEMKRSELPPVIEPEPHQASKEVETDHLSNPTGDMPAPPFHVVPVRLVKADPPDSWPLPPGPVDLLTMMRNDKCIVKAGGFSRTTDTSDWAALPEEPCRFCRVPGGVVFLIDDGPPGRESPVIVRCQKCGRHWEADSRYA